jgi:biopolymer transport protein ExbD
MRRLLDRQDRSIAINMTPMVDVTFLLLTFCMLTTRFATSEKVTVDLPRPNDNQAIERRFKDKIIINVQYAGETAKAQIQLGPVKVASMEDLSSRLNELTRQDPNAQVILRADRRLAYRDVRGVMEAVAGARLTHLQVVTEMEQQR